MPDRETWEASAKRLPTEADTVKVAMQEACEHTEILYELEVAKDMLKKRTPPAKSQHPSAVFAPNLRTFS